MLEKHKKFAAYWKSIGKPELEILYEDEQWHDLLIEMPNFYGLDYRIKDDPHWELRREWIDSDFTLPIELYYENDQEWERCESPIWANNIKYRKAQTNEDKTMPEFKIGDKVKIVNKTEDHWVNEMDNTIGMTGSISRLHEDGCIYVDLKNGKSYWYQPECLELLPKENDMTEQNPHAALIDEYCEDWKVSNTPWKNWQWMGFDEKWTDCDMHPYFDETLKYRRKPKIININGFDVPMPIHVKPEIGQEYFYPSIALDDLYTENEWENDSVDNRILDRGFCHLDKESAIIHAKALLSFTIPK